MVACHQCSTPNSLDSAFCKRCGHALPEDDLREAQEKIAGWIKEGNTAFGEGRIDEALAITTSALESNPNYIDALVLKGLCHERQGNIPEALACAERIVELNPDSELDKIRRNGLRVQLGGSLVVPGASDRRAGMVFAGGLALLALSVCVYAINRTGGTPTAQKTSSPPPVTAPGFTYPQQAAPQPQTTSQPSTQSPAIPYPTQRVRQQDPSDDGNDNSAGTLPYRVPVGVIPDDHGLQPNNHQEQPNQQTTVAQNGGGDDPAPTVENPTPSDTGKPTVPTPVDPGPGIIHITVHKADAQPVSSNGVAALVHAGMQQFAADDFSAAANTLKKALDGGGDPIRLNQRLGQAYENLGRTSDAVAAYARAVSACQQALASGAGNKREIQQLLDNCQSAGKVLGG